MASYGSGLSSAAGQQSAAAQMQGVSIAEMQGYMQAQQNVAGALVSGKASQVSGGSGFRDPFTYAKTVPEVEVVPIPGPMDAIVKRQPRKMRIKE